MIRWVAKGQRGAHGARIVRPTNDPTIFLQFCPLLKSGIARPTFHVYLLGMSLLEATLGNTVDFREKGLNGEFERKEDLPAQIKPMRIRFHGLAAGSWRSQAAAPSFRMVSGT